MNAPNRAESVRHHVGWPRPSGLTLIELLVVISIIAILGGILLPVLSTARADSRVTQCVSNVRSQVTVVHQYADDHKGLMPPRPMWLTALDDAGVYATSPWLINRILGSYIGEEFPKPAIGYPVPIGAWRCPEVPPEQDFDRQTHSGILHYAPNQWLFSTLVQNEQAGTLFIVADVLPGWSDRYGGHAWRQLHEPPLPGQIVTLMDNVNYYSESHGHTDARESYGRSCEIVPPPNECNYTNAGSHERVHARPASYLDGHAEALPDRGAYWVDQEFSYRARFSPSAPLIRLHQREVTRLMWFISARDRQDDD